MATTKTKNPSIKAYRKVIKDLLEMLEDWNMGDENGMSGFAGFCAVEAAEKILQKRKTIKPRLEKKNGITFKNLFKKKEN